MWICPGDLLSKGISLYQRSRWCVEGVAMRNRVVLRAEIFDMFCT
jgi:hypothetical protein